MVKGLTYLWSLKILHRGEKRCFCCVLGLINNSCTVLVLQFYRAVCLYRCQAIQYAGEHPGTSQALWLWCQHAGTLICLCEHDSERERKMEERRDTMCPCGQPVNHPFHIQLKTLALSWGSSTHFNCLTTIVLQPQKKSLVIIMACIHSSKASLVCIQ